MEGASCLVEAARVDENSSSFLVHEKAKLREPEIIADSEAKFAVFGVKNRDIISFLKRIRFFISDFARNIDVKEMNFIHFGDQVPFRINNERGIEELRFFPLSLFPRD